MIRVGIGGWSFAPWRGLFYPKGLPGAEELSYASRHVTAIEINSTFYRTQSRESFVKWREATPDDFIFSVKAHRAAVNASALAETSDRIEHFLASGVLELSDKLGPILWQLAPYKRFHAEEIAAFLKLLPKKRGARRLRHALEVRHESFLHEKFIALLREANVAAVFADSDDYPAIADATADFVYARLQRTRENCATGYEAKDLDLWAKRARAWEKGETPADLPHLAAPAKKSARDVFVFMIAGAKQRAPAAAEALIARLRA
ncbi:DUF72 domain-containing protein [Methylosinus sp. Ce-a6]|uniref:DUF72 domain-containing protein n=1 Tax=Methylosinus sp. Ce-a6 TaxID=2172005 RepID=UPI00135C01B4|nr:DUF72 domain-containing protein [Methylosinus sp. Ce-a6]